MAMVPKLIKAALNLQKALPEQVLSQGQTLLKGLTGNSHFTNLPVDLNVFKTYAASFADAKDGGKKAITLRNKQGGVVIRTMKHLATYVELNCKDDMSIFLSSGFHPRSSAHTPAQPLDQPTIGHGARSRSTPSSAKSSAQSRSVRPGRGSERP